MKSVVGRPHYCFFKFSFSPGVCVVHRSQFQATSALWSKASNLHYSLKRFPPSPSPPSPAKHTQLSYTGLRHNRGGCRAGPGRPSMTDPWPSDTVRRKRNVLAPSLLELQRERRKTTELGYLGRCRRQPRKHTGPIPVHPWQRAWFMVRDPGLRGETGLPHRPGLILTPAVPHIWAPPGPGQVFFYRSGLWSLGVGIWDLDWSGLRTQDSVNKEIKVCDWGPE
jgi:hypothetical protein